MTGNGKHTSYKNGDDWGMVIIVLTTLLYFLWVLPMLANGDVTCVKIFKNTL
jgi:hypothetical protein